MANDANDPEMVLYAAKGLIAELPAEERAKCEAAIARVRQAVSECGDYGILAIALLLAELQVRS